MTTAELREKIEELKYKRWLIELKDILSSSDWDKITDLNVEIRYLQNQLPVKMPNFDEQFPQYEDELYIWTQIPTKDGSYYAELTGEMTLEEWREKQKREWLAKYGHRVEA